MHGLVRYKLERRCWRACGEDMSFTDVKIKVSDRKVDQWMWMMWCTGSARGGFGGFEKVSWVLRSEEEGWLLLARNGLVAGATRVEGGAYGKASIQRLCLSPYVEIPFNAKVIKSFVPELRSRKCFSCFGIPMFYVYMLRTFYVRFTYPDIWLCYISSV